MLLVKFGEQPESLYHCSGLIQELSSCNRPFTCRHAVVLCHSIATALLNEAVDASEAAHRQAVAPLPSQPVIKPMSSNQPHVNVQGKAVSGCQCVLM